MQWFNKELKIERNKITAMYKRYRKNRDNAQLKEIYINSRNKYKKLIKETKKKSWINFCTETKDAYGGLYKYIAGKKLQNTDLIFMTLTDSEIFDAYDEVAERLMIEHFKINEVPTDIYEFTTNGKYNLIPDKELIGIRELKYALSKQAVNKAPGWE